MGSASSVVTAVTAAAALLRVSVSSPEGDEGEGSRVETSLTATMMSIIATSIPKAVAKPMPVRIAASLPQLRRTSVAVAAAQSGSMAAASYSPCFVAQVIVQQPNGSI